MLTLLFADRRLGAASKLAFYQLWKFAGEKPGRIVITADFLAGQCGRSPKSAWDWLAELERHDLIKIGERNERCTTAIVGMLPTIHPPIFTRRYIPFCCPPIVQEYRVFPQKTAITEDGLRK